MEVPATVRLSVPGDPRSLALVRSIVTSLAEDAGLAETEIAVDEACTNVLEHAYRGLSPAPPIDLVLHVTEDTFSVEIIDHGRSFDFEGYRLPTFPDHWHDGNTRGVGLYLIRNCMDSVTYRRGKDANRMLLKKKLTANPSAPPGGKELPA